jgi:undecaprenyl-diphosphatase
MTSWEGFVLGLVQGLTEFLPVSSDGHLAMSRAILGLRGPDLPFDVFVHGATLLAILVYFRRRLVELVRDRSYTYIAKLAVGTVPAVIVALVFRRALDLAFGTPAVVVPAIAVTGSALLSLYLIPEKRWHAAESGDERSAGTKEPTWLDAWWIGCAQALAILPGVSRSGSTIVTGIWLGLAPASAAEFSFLMGIPAITGALVLEAPRMSAAAASGQAATYLTGAAIAFASGLTAIALVFRLLPRREFRWFGFYCWAAAIAFALFLWAR